ncbi:MAG TPA: acyltransferase family protein [Acidimicrobiales bacterium]|nr:acyltransferase family protein [Acidimicrobiales bacterium]
MSDPPITGASDPGTAAKTETATATETATESALPHKPGSGPQLPYVSALDGVRAFSIIGIMANHNGLGWATGGFISVNVFFVLSGFLITALLVKEWAKSGTISLRRFWGRRARRLLPALFVLLVGIAFYAWLIAPADSRGALRTNSLSTLFYVANWHQIYSGQSYFTQAAIPSPLLHTWTLAIEEQFYLVWPLIVLAILKFSRSIKTLLGFTVVAAVGSAVEMALLFHGGTDPSRLYYGTDTRAQDLLIGATVALLLARRGPARTPRVTQGMSVLVVAALAGFGLEWARLTESSGFPYRGGFLLADLLVGLVILGVVQAPAGLPSRIMGWRPIAYTGRISYGLYLWHWPIILTLTGARTGLTGWPLFLVRSAITFVFAAASARFVENPIRRGSIRSWKAWVMTPAAAGATAAVVLLATASPAATATAAGASAPASSATGIPAHELAQLDTAHAFTTDPVRFMFLGDSIAVTLAIGLEVNSQPVWGVESLFKNASLGCDLDPTLQIRVSGSQGLATPGCIDWQTKWAADVKRDRPEVVALLLGRWESADHLYQGTWTHVGQPLWDNHLQAELNQAVGILSAGGAKVVLMTTPYLDPTEAPDGSTYPENEPSRTDAYNAIVYRVAAQHPGVVTVYDLNKVLSPNGRYTPTVDGVTVRWSDGIHISKDGGLWMRSKLLPEVASLGLIDRGI